MWTEQVREMILNGILETLYMTVVSTVFGYIFRWEFSSVSATRMD